MELNWYMNWPHCRLGGIYRGSMSVISLFACNDLSFKCSMGSDFWSLAVMQSWNFMVTLVYWDLRRCQFWPLLFMRSCHSGWLTLTESTLFGFRYDSCFGFLPFLRWPCYTVVCLHLAVSVSYILARFCTNATLYVMLCHSFDMLIPISFLLFSPLLFWGQVK